MQRQGVQILVDIAMNLYPDAASQIGTESYQRLVNLVVGYIHGQISHKDALQASMSFAGTTQPIDKIHEILTLPNDPIPFEGIEVDESNPRKKSRSWSAYEDARLIAGIYRFGIDNWTSISRFVGNGRTRSQCSQRWQRGLDPHLSKDQWTTAEEHYLVQLVQYYGDRSWTQIANKMGNRSDVQCRYRYKQMQKDRALHARSLVAMGFGGQLRKTHSGIISPPVIPSQVMPAQPMMQGYNPMLNHPNPMSHMMMSLNGSRVKGSNSQPVIQFEPIPHLDGGVIKELPKSIEAPVSVAAIQPKPRPDLALSASPRGSISGIVFDDFMHDDHELFDFGSIEKSRADAPPVEQRDERPVSLELDDLRLDDHQWGDAFSIF